MVRLFLCLYGSNRLKITKDIKRQIDWSMTPTKAVDMYLEWGSGWTRGAGNFVADANDVSYYFVIYEGDLLFDRGWERTFVSFIKRTVEGATELGRIEVPNDLWKNAIMEDGPNKAGVEVHAINQELAEWLQENI